MAVKDEVRRSVKQDGLIGTSSHKPANNSVGSIQVAMPNHGSPAKRISHFDQHVVSKVGRMPAGSVDLA